MRWSVLCFPVVATALVIAASVLLGPDLSKGIERAQSSFFSFFSGGFLIAGVLAFFTALVAFVSPLGKKKIGGESAVPLLSRWKWFTVSICTTTAVGLLFWATAEPIFHFSKPPESLGLLPFSQESARFSLATLFLHWTWIPCAFYAVPALAFSLAFYDLKAPFSLGSFLTPLTDKKAYGAVLDSLCLFSLLCGMAASLGAGVLTLSGGLKYLFGWNSSPGLWAALGAAIVVSFTFSSLAGLSKGIERLANLNVQIFIVLALGVFIYGPTRSILEQSYYAGIDFVESFVTRSLALGFSPTDPWPQQWTVFYWANWLAWAPVTAVFLGQLGRGYTVREFLWVNLALPALFSAVWMGIFGGASLYWDSAQSHPLTHLLETRGPESLVYYALAQIPGSVFLIPLFVFCVFLSYVSGADANTTAMAGLCWKGISPESPEPPKGLKIFWGSLIGMLSVIVLSNAGLDGVRGLSNLGGVPALGVIFLSCLTLWKFTWKARETFRIHPERTPVEA